MKYLKKILFLTIATTVASSCKKLDLAPTNQFSELNFWTTSTNVNNELNSVYNGMYNSDLYFYNDAMSDNAYAAGGSPTGNVTAVVAGSYNSALDKFLNDWSYHYSGIYTCNLFLTNVDQNKTLSADVIARMKAEVRFIRAFHYFYLETHWGDVPLITTTISPDQSKTQPRVSKATVVNFIISELEACAAALPSKDQYTTADAGRITNGAALALEARVLLYQGNRMADVVTVCEKLMNNPGTYGTYSLASSYSSLFNDPTVNKINNESILSLQYLEGTVGRTWGDYYDFAPISAGARDNGLSPTQELVNDYIMLNGRPIADPASGYNENTPYVNRDPRLTATIVYDQYKWVNPDGSTQIIYIKPGSDPDQKTRLNEYRPAVESVSSSGYYWRKYFDPNHLTGLASGLNLHMIRWAEVLLDYAEAENSLGQMNATVWNKTIMLLRQRAGFTDANALNYPGNDDMTNIIRRERRVELAMEGLRTEDINRWKISETVLNGYAHGAKFADPTVDNGYIRVQLRHFDPSKNYLWPIPFNEIQKDSKLTQNPGY